MKTCSCIIILLIALLLPLSTHANTFCVSDATGLQTALTTAAGNGEDATVQIEQGTYVGSFIYTSTEAFNLTVEGGYLSECGSRGLDPTNTVLDANETGSVLIFSVPDTNANLEVEGLTLQNGVAGNGNGGGIYAKTLGDIIITNNILMGNSANNVGGGVYTYSESNTITLTNNTITGNSTNNLGGGVYAYTSSGVITLTNNTTTGNSAIEYGGGVYVRTSSGDITLTNNTTTGNSATSYGGGGVYAYTSSGNIEVPLN